jgi:hypothetical protein
MSGWTTPILRSKGDIIFVAPTLGDERNACDLDIAAPRFPFGADATDSVALAVRGGCDRELDAHDEGRSLPHEIGHRRSQSAATGLARRKTKAR